MHECLSLDGEWRFKGYVGEDWAYRRAYRANTREAAGWLTGRVPGSVQHDLWQAGEISDPYYGRNSLSAEWTSQRAWVYRRSFTPEPACQGRRIRLRCEGVDYEAHFYLNGELLGSRASMFTPALFEVGDLLKYGEQNLLAVVLLPAPMEQPQIGRTSLVRTHKTRMNYWWDFCPRLVHLGIWDHVTLEITGPARIEDVYVRPQLAPDFARAELPVHVDLSAEQALEVEVVASVSYEGQTVDESRTAAAVAAGRHPLTLNLVVPEPRLWWPNGAGGQPLYEAQVVVTARGQAAEMTVSDRRTVTFGIRRVEFLPNETPDTTARPYTFVVNGRKIYVRGWNWAPMDVLYGVERPERLANLIELAKAAGANLLRVWGGGLIEREDFYEACDRAGLMVWQEFIQSSSGMDNLPPEDPGMIDMMVREAETIVPRRRNHASLVLWCGGNELRNADDGPAHGDEPILAALEAVVRRLDPDRGWLPSSPSGRVFFNMLPDIARDPLGLHDAHGQWNYQGLTEQYTLYNAGTALFSSEFGVEGTAHLEVLEATLPEARRWPMSAENPYWTHSASWWCSDEKLRQAFGQIPDLPALVLRSQYLQFEGLRYAVEANRRRQWRNSGALPWQFNEPFPNASCTSAVDYFGQPKPAYYAVARAYAPIAIVASFAGQALAGQEEFTPEVHVISALAEAVQARWIARLVGASGEVWAEQEANCLVPADGAAAVGQVRWPLAGIEEEALFLDLRLVVPLPPGAPAGMPATPEVPAPLRYGVIKLLGERAKPSGLKQLAKVNAGIELAANRYPFSRTADLRPFLAFPRTRLDAGCSTEGDRWLVTIANRGRTAALNLWLQDDRPLGSTGYVYFSDNYITLLPGEARIILAEWRGVSDPGRRLRLVGWNTATKLIVATA